MSGNYQLFLSSADNCVVKVENVIDLKVNNIFKFFFTSYRHKNHLQTNIYFLAG